MKVLVTGAKGFIGKNLIAYLSKEEDVEIIEFDIEDKLEDLDIKNIDFIFHLAGINRPKDASEFNINADLTQQLVELLKENDCKTPLVISSSTQAELDNDYGNSKKRAEEYLLENYPPSIIYRFHNVFGKWCRPNYNSVVATFCNNIANDLDIQINDPKSEIELVYIDDICETLIKELYGKIQHKEDINYIEPRKKINLKDLSELIYSFKDCMNSIYTPKTGDPFVKKLFATFVSYLPPEKMIQASEKHEDERGAFSELVKTLDSGQFSVSYSKPGVIRGNHYHHTKMERFIVIKGQAKIKFRHIITNEQYEYNVDDSKLQIVTIPVGYTHSIENIGPGEMILFLWCNEIFDEDHPDTYYEEV